MNTVAEMAMSPSPEAEISRQIEELVRKLALGQASSNDIQLLHDLQKQRVELMRPKFFDKKQANSTAA